MWWVRGSEGFEVGEGLWVFGGSEDPGQERGAGEKGFQGEPRHPCGFPLSLRDDQKN